MTYTAPAHRIGREFDAFLFASLGDDRHGQPLSVLSTLARSDVDPWREAGALSEMPGREAAARLAALIAAVADEPIAGRPVGVLAHDLIALLPDTVSCRRRATPEPPTDHESENTRAALGAGAIALLIAFALLISAPRSVGPVVSAATAAVEHSVALSQD
jgi:hypothetical protein